jgi:hypothetical protein
LDRSRRIARTAGDGLAFTSLRRERAQAGRRLFLSQRRVTGDPAGPGLDLGPVPEVILGPVAFALRSHHNGAAGSGPVMEPG